MSQVTPTTETPGTARRLEWSLRPQGEHAPEVEPGSIPRVARLMALAIHFEGLLCRGDVPDYATLARLGQVTRARMSQIMGLLHLAPDIQEEILFLPRTIQGRDPVTEHDLRPIASLLDWDRQRAAWRRLRQHHSDLPCCRAQGLAVWTEVITSREQNSTAPRPPTTDP